MADKLLIKNARLVNEGQITAGDLLIHNGRIAQIDDSICAGTGVRVLDAAGAQHKCKGREGAHAPT